MGLNDVATLIDGYYCILSVGYHKGVVESVIKYSPFSGQEMDMAFFDELRFQVSVSLSRREKDADLLKDWESSLSMFTPSFSVDMIPERLKFLALDRTWFYIKKQRDRKRHHGGEFCGEFSGCFIDSCYERADNLPKLACVPIQYCPFCGVKLSAEFDQENWWEKEFKTFKWYKDRKMGEWADDYVDDHDWTEDVYPPVMKNGFAYNLAPRANRFEKRIVHKYKPLGDKRWQLIEEIDPETGELLNVVKDGKIRVEDWEERK